MATILESQDLLASLQLRFTALDRPEADSILADLRQTVVDRIEYHGFHPEGVTVLTETVPKEN